MEREKKSSFRLEPVYETLALKRLCLAAFMQMTFPGVACIYYGDEIGMQGLEDPFNRKPFTWRNVDVDLLEFYKNLAAVRSGSDCLRFGEIDVLYAKDDVFVYSRHTEDAKYCQGFDMAICVVNRAGETRCAEIKLRHPALCDLFDLFSEKVICKGADTIRLEVEGFGTGLYLCKKEFGNK